MKLIKKLIEFFWNGLKYTLIDAFTRHVLYTVAFLLLYLSSAFLFKTEYMVNTCLVFIIGASIYWLYSLFRHDETIREKYQGIASTLRLSLIALGASAFIGLFIQKDVNPIVGSILFFVAYTLSIGAYLHENSTKSLTVS